MHSRMNDTFLTNIEGFDKIAMSPGRILSVLSAIDQVRLRIIDEEARAGAEKYIREAKGWMRRVWRETSFNRQYHIEKQKQALVKEKFDIGSHHAEIRSLIDIASNGPEVAVKRDKKTGEIRSLANQYLTKGFDAAKMEHFNKIATKYTDKKRKDSKKIAEAYEKAKVSLLSDKDESQTEAMRMLNDAEFEIRMKQILNMHADGVIELIHLAEAKGWAAQLHSLNMKKSLAVSVIEAIAMPFSRSGDNENRRNNLVKQKELVQIALEQDRTARNKSELFKKKIEDLDNKLSAPPASPESFHDEKELLKDRLQVRIEYGKRKINGPLFKQYQLIQALSHAQMSVEMHTTGGHMRRSKLASLLEPNERNIDNFIAGAGYEIGGMLHQYFGSHGANEIHKHAQELRANGEMRKASHLEKMLEEGVKNFIVHQNASLILKELR